MTTRLYHPDPAANEVPLTIRIDHEARSIELATIELSGPRAFGTFTSAARTLRGDADACRGHDGAEDEDGDRGGAHGKEPA